MESPKALAMIWRGSRATSSRDPARSCRRAPCGPLPPLRRLAAEALLPPPRHDAPGHDDRRRAADDLHPPLRRLRGVHHRQPEPP